MDYEFREVNGAHLVGVVRAQCCLYINHNVAVVLVVDKVFLSKELQGKSISVGTWTTLLPNRN